MTSTSFPSAVQFSPVSTTSTFRLAVQVLGNGHAPSEDRHHELQYVRKGQKWVLKVVHLTANVYSLSVRAPETVKSFTFRKYQQTRNGNIQYMDEEVYFDGAVEPAPFRIGVEIAVAEELVPSVSTSPWNFRSSELMQNWDIVLSVSDAKFYVHKQTLSLMSTTFLAMLNGEFRETNPQEVRVNVEGTSAEHFEAFLQCLYPYGCEPQGEFIVPLAKLAKYYNVKPVQERCVAMLARLPDISKLDQLRVAIMTHSTALEEAVISAMSKDEICELLASDIKGELNGARLEKVTAKLFSS